MTDRPAAANLPLAIDDGRLRRKPSAWNSYPLRGDMSFIGPRPEMAEVEAWANTEVPGFSDRLAIKPGITGLAQVTQGYTPRDAEAYRRKLAINLEYLARLSWQSDLEILGRTLVWMALGRGWKWRGKRS